MSASDTRPLYGVVDLGGTKIYTAVADAGCTWLGEDHRPTEAELPLDDVIQRIVDSLQASIDHAGIDARRIAALGVASPGPIDIERGLILRAPNLGGWRDVPLAARLAEIFARPAILENDANAAALGEHVFGAGRGVKNLVYITVSTGIGGGLILDGRLYRGATGSAGELGHMVIDEDGPLCGCGTYGCLETLASGTAIGARGAEAVAHRLSEPIARRAAGHEVTAEHVAAAAAEGDPVAAEIIFRAGHFLGLGFSTIVNIFNPDMIVVGGGAAKIGRPLLEPALATMRARAFHGPAAHVQVVSAALGGRSVAAGALALARDLDG